MKMNRSASLLATALLATTLFVTACAKPPQEEMTAAQAAIDQAKGAQAEIYASNTYRAAGDSLAAATAEIQAQASKFALFRKYDRAKALIAASQTTAAKAQNEAVAEKERAKGAANEALTMATAAVDSAKVVLATAPVGKDNKADVERMKADLAGAETALEGVRQAISSEDFYGAKQKADDIKNQSMTIVNDVNAAIEKMRGGKK